ncbi:uncharacterized protein HRG_08766 [Hirsutella rhossiliensis]|uniref:Uncharacterized protein n=1 Tax=Hirsutella rhossiliensis TaxID=111463 RepID=A0A9P8MUR7_9HYPO|nr:uncharacterized protein HRG_08766 [Hirsutella rhossiliensis]KAH0960611.1 hypothetical protein HRG_08766 [Hirsutella rhossiliensis]
MPSSCSCIYKTQRRTSSTPKELLESWYDAVNEHQTLLQVFQPLQLFALYHPGFDHYWQVELDQRFLGQAGKYLDVVSAFAWHEPRKQAPERATYPLNVDEYGTYDKFLSRVDRANRGPEDDAFSWGVGEYADVIVSSFCGNILQSEWVFRDFILGFRFWHNQVTANPLRYGWRNALPMFWASDLLRRAVQKGVELARWPEAICTQDVRWE